MNPIREQVSSETAQMWEKYVRAERFLPWNAARLTSEFAIKPNWIDSGERFWYRTKNRSGFEFVLVDLKNESRMAAFDHQRLAAGLSTATGMAYSANALPFKEIEFLDGGKSIAFELDEPLEDGRRARWTCDLTSYACTHLEDRAAPRKDVVGSPDGQWEALTKDNNVWVRSTSSGDERAITQDGVTNNGYGDPMLSPLTSAGISDAPPPAIFWSPDSSKLLFCRIDQREALQFHLVQSVPKDGSIRPRLHSYAYPLPGDEKLPTAQFFVADVSKGTLTQADLEPLPLLYYGAPTYPERSWWSPDSQSVYLIRRERGYQAYSLTVIDASTGAARLIVEERGKRAIDLSLDWMRTNVRVFGNGAQVIWYAQRDGWGHLYLYNAAGALQRQLTSGNYAVDEVVYIDEAAGMVYFTALGRIPDRDPYYAHLYRVPLAGGEPVLLTQEDADHTIAFAPGGQYFIDTYSTVGQPPVSVMRALDGRKVTDLEQADIAPLLATGWQAPERFHAKSRDGVTDVYGVIFRPSNFDPTQQYPVIDSIYAGPQTNQAPVSFADSRRSRPNDFWQAQALAELGFVVVMIDGLGMPGRSKAYHDVSYHDLGDAGLQDHITALRELADRYPYFDLSRVGIYGHSAGGYASARAILTYPDFYKVCVSSAGNHDHRLDKAVWVERYMGFPVEDHYRVQANQTNAANLKGKLLLIHGEMDENVHVSSTLVVVDELIKADKDFDLLIMPNQPHACTNHAYFVRRRWDYFVRHLRGEEPPAGYHIQPDTRG
jgi:dipeptidyl aminopeptidase/acylaminoacyl peptidase